MHAHPSDRFIRDSGATIMATGYMYAAIARASFIIASGWYAPRAHHRGGFFDHYDRVRRDLEDRCTRFPASPRLALTNIVDGSRAPLSPIYLPA